MARALSQVTTRRKREKPDVFLAVGKNNKSNARRIVFGSDKIARDVFFGDCCYCSTFSVTDGGRYAVKGVRRRFFVRKKVKKVNIDMRVLSSFATGSIRS